MSKRWLMIATLAASSWGASAHSQTQPQEPPPEDREEEDAPLPPVGNSKNPSYCSLDE